MEKLRNPKAILLLIILFVIASAVIFITQSEESSEVVEIQDSELDGLVDDVSEEEEVAQQVEIPIDASSDIQILPLADGTDSWKTYSDIERGFEIKYPENWSYEFEDLERLQGFTKYRLAESIITFKPAETNHSVVELIIYSNPDNLSATEFLQKWNDVSPTFMREISVDGVEISYLSLGGINGTISAVWQYRNNVFDLEDITYTYQESIFPAMLSTLKVI